jgi:hypothetical protein
LDLRAQQIGHHRAVPDTADYEWLGWLVAHPEEWTKGDLAAARSMLADQKRTVEDARAPEGRQESPVVAGGRRPAGDRAPDV